MSAEKLPSTASSAPSELLSRNTGQPIRLSGVNLCGFSAEAARSPGTVKVWTKLILTSDDPLFHKIVENFGAVIADLGRKVGENIDLSRADDVLLVVRPDETAELWVETAAVSAKILAKRVVSAGSLLYESDIADVIELRFPAINIGPQDKVLYLFRQDWRFGLFFDFNPAGDLSIDEFAKGLGTLYRRLKFRHLYDMLDDNAVFAQLMSAGWFPFAEIVGNEFKPFASACGAGFSLDDAEAEVLRSFDEARLARLLKRWIAKPHFRPKEPILRAAIDAYRTQNWVAVLKIVLTEIEGILAEAYTAATGKRAKLNCLLDFAIKAAERKAGAPDTLLFPAAFAKYLKEYTYASFDPQLRVGAAGSRHAVGHGAAAAETYTQARALQALLVLDQFAFYT